MSNTFFLKKYSEVKRFLSFFAIGLFTTFLTYLLWTLLFNLSGIFELDKAVRFSGAQFISSFTIIFLSFYLNRIFTFKDRATKLKKFSHSLLSFYALYISSSILASLFTFTLQFLFPILNNEVLKLLGLGFGMVYNYLGQKFLIYS